MYKYVLIFLLVSSLMFTSGCWSKHELIDLGFVLGIALDTAKDHQIELTAQIYRPSPGNKGGGGKNQSTINVKATNQTIEGAIRDIPIHLGREPQWSHMRIIIVSEKVARSQNIGKLLDYFYRDYQTRSNVLVVIAAGRADTALKLPPKVEKSSSQELVQANLISHSASSKTLVTTLLQLGIQDRNAHIDGHISYLYEINQKKITFSNAGLALTKTGKMVGLLSPAKTEGFVMLRNEFEYGMISVPCTGEKHQMETLEVLKMRTKLNIEWKNGKPAGITAFSDVDVAISELKCSYVRTPEDEAKLVKAAEGQIRKSMLESYHELQKQNIEAIGISNQIYRKYPQTWAVLKEHWDDEFSKLPLQVNVKIRITTSGVSNSIPVL